MRSYISKIKEGGAAHNTEVKVGMKILAMNGQPMVLALKSEASGSLKDEETAIMTLQFDPQGFGSYDGVRICQHTLGSLSGFFAPPPFPGPCEVQQSL